MGDLTDMTPFILTAARFNQRLILDWVCQCTDLVRSVYHNSVIIAAATYNNTDIVKWLYMKTRHVRVDLILSKIVCNNNLDLLIFVIENRPIEDGYTNILSHGILWFIQQNIEFACCDVAILWKGGSISSDEMDKKMLELRDKMTSAVWHFAADMSRVYPCLEFVETVLKIPFPPVIFMKTLDDNIRGWFQNRGVPVEIK